MLTDLPRNWIPPRDAILDLLAGKNRTPERISKGLYLAHVNFNHDLGSLVGSDEPFTGWMWGPRNETESEAKERLHRIRESFEQDGPEDFGVCDYPAQVVETWPIIETDPRPFLIYFSLVRRSDEPKHGGWRWHKWGRYIGTQERHYEYIADEPHIEQVYTFQVIELNAKVLV